jgi:hypothetical protein
VNQFADRLILSASAVSANAAFEKSAVAPTLKASGTWGFKPGPPLKDLNVLWEGAAAPATLRCGVSTGL